MQIDKRMKEKERLAYINPDLALEEKTKGNKFFQDGKLQQSWEYENMGMLAFKKAALDHLIWKKANQNPPHHHHHQKIPELITHHIYLW